MSPSDIPNSRDLILPTLQAVAALGGSAQASEITDHVIDSCGFDDEVIAETYESRDTSILIDRIDWASRTPSSPALWRARSGVSSSSLPSVGRSWRWRADLLARLHRLSPAGFEEFVVYLLKTFGLQLKRVGGSGDEGIDGIGLAPISPVLSSRVAVQAKRYEPSRSVSRDAVALFQRDASAAGAERAVFVTLGRFTEPARRAATLATPTVDLIDGSRLCELVRQQEVGVHTLPVVDEAWFDRFEQDSGAEV